MYHLLVHSYKAAIFTNPDLSNAEKFTYLQLLVQCMSKDACPWWSFSKTANYEEAVTILERKFGNKQQAVSKQIVSKHMDILLNVKAVTSAKNGSFIGSMKKLKAMFEV